MLGPDAQCAAWPAATRGMARVCGADVAHVRGPRPRGAQPTATRGTTRLGLGRRGARGARRTAAQHVAALLGEPAMTRRRCTGSG
jgi:hypothetical protein